MSTWPAACGFDRKPRRSNLARVRDSTQRVLDAMTGAPGLRAQCPHDALAANSLWFALYTDVFDPDALPLNLAHLLFLEPRAADVFVDWQNDVDDAVATLRELVGELSIRSEHFRVLWVRSLAQRAHGVK